jgi:hypothetical protein
LVSGETLRAPRQQLRQPRASAFDLSLNFLELFQVLINCAPNWRALCFWLRIYSLSVRGVHRATQVDSYIHKFVRYPKNKTLCEFFGVLS